jgi:hypothetical protein
MVNPQRVKHIDIARALGVSAAAVTKHAKAGMPTSSIEAAQAWHRAHIDPVRSAGQRLHTVARMTAARPTAASRSVRQASPAAASRSVRQASPAAAPPGGVVAEFLSIASACRCGGSVNELPAPAVCYMRALLRVMTPAQFTEMYLGANQWGMRGADALLPAAFLQWTYAGPDDDCADDVPAEDMPLLQQLVAGQASFQWDPAGPWPRFRDCVAPMPWAALDLVAAKRDFEAFVQTSALMEPHQPPGPTQRHWSK